MWCTICLVQKGDIVALGSQTARKTEAEPSTMPNSRNRRSSVDSTVASRASATARAAYFSPLSQPQVATPLQLSNARRPLLANPNADWEEEERKEEEEMRRKEKEEEERRKEEVEQAAKQEAAARSCEGGAPGAVEEIAVTPEPLEVCTGGKSGGSDEIDENQSTHSGSANGEDDGENQDSGAQDDNGVPDDKPATSRPQLPSDSSSSDDDSKGEVPGATKLVKPVTIIAQALGFKGCTARPDVNPGAWPSAAPGFNRIWATRHASQSI